MLGFLRDHILKFLKALLFDQVGFFLRPHFRSFWALIKDLEIILCLQLYIISPWQYSGFFFHLRHFFLILTWRYFFIAFERQRKGEGETSVWVRSINWLPPVCTQTGDCTSPDWESNLKPFSHGMMLQPTQPAPASVEGCFFTAALFTIMRDGECLIVTHSCSFLLIHPSFGWSLSSHIFLFLARSSTVASQKLFLENFLAYYQVHEVYFLFFISLQLTLLLNFQPWHRKDPFFPVSTAFSSLYVKTPCSLLPARRHPLTGSLRFFRVSLALYSTSS